MRPIAMCPVTVKVARVLRDAPGVQFSNEGLTYRNVLLFDNEFALLCGVSLKRAREALLNLERLGAILAEDLLPGPSREPKPRAILVTENAAAWLWLDAYNALEVAYAQLPKAVK